MEAVQNNFKKQEQHSVCSDRDLKPRPFQSSPQSEESLLNRKNNPTKKICQSITQVADATFREKFRFKLKDPAHGSFLMYSCKCRGRHVFSASVPPTTFMHTQPNSWDNLEEQHGSWPHVTSDVHGFLLISDDLDVSASMCLDPVWVFDTLRPLPCPLDIFPLALPGVNWPGRGTLTIAWLKWNQHSRLQQSLPRPFTCTNNLRIGFWRERLLGCSKTHAG